MSTILQRDPARQELLQELEQDEKEDTSFIVPS